MTKRKCFKEHAVLYLETLCQTGRDCKHFDYCVTTYYCHLCNKVRTQRKIYFKIPNIFKKKDSDIPF